jgi:hypothetical protein
MIRQGREFDPRSDHIFARSDTNLLAVVLASLILKAAFHFKPSFLLFWL